MVDMAARRKGYRTTEPGARSLSFHLVWSSADRSGVGAEAERCALSTLPAASLGVWGCRPASPGPGGVKGFSALSPKQRRASVGPRVGRRAPVPSCMSTCALSISTAVVRGAGWPQAPQGEFSEDGSSPCPPTPRCWAHGASPGLFSWD